jgi:hypothetical protein
MNNNSLLVILIVFSLSSSHPQQSDYLEQLLVAEIL